MTTTTLTPATMLETKMKLTVAMIALGIVIASFAGFGLIRTLIFQSTPTDQALTPLATPQPFQAAPNVKPWQADGQGTVEQPNTNVDLIPVPTAVLPWPTFDPNIPVVTDFVVVIPGSNGINQTNNGFTTHSGLKGGK